MRLVNIKERLPTDVDADATGEIVCIGVSLTRGLRYCFSSTGMLLHVLNDLKRNMHHDPLTDDIFWLELDPQKPAPLIATSHIRKVEL